MESFCTFHRGFKPLQYFKKADFSSKIVLVIKDISRSICKKQNFQVNPIRVLLSQTTFERQQISFDYKHRAMIVETNVRWCTVLQISGVEYREARYFRNVKYITYQGRGKNLEGKVSVVHTRLRKSKLTYSREYMFYQPETQLKEMVANVLKRF